MPELPEQETKQTMIEGSINLLMVAITNLENLSIKIGGVVVDKNIVTEPKPESNPHLARFLSELPKTIANAAARINSCIESINGACF